MRAQITIALLVLVVPFVGCIGTSGPEAGELVIRNNDNQEHAVAIEWDSRSVNLTVAPDSNRVLTLTDSPGSYMINVTVDGSVFLNETVSYSPGGGSGEEPAGPVINLIIESDRSYFSRSYD